MSIDCPCVHDLDFDPDTGASIECKIRSRWFGEEARKRRPEVDDKRAETAPRAEDLNDSFSFSNSRTR